MVLVLLALCFTLVFQNQIPVSYASPAYEDFTTYTKVDLNSHISKTSSRVTFTTLLRSESAYVYKDKDVGHFSGDFEHLIEAMLTDKSLGTGYTPKSFIWLLGQAIGDYLTVEGSNVLAVSLDASSATVVTIGLWEYYAEAPSYTDVSISLSYYTQYYLTIERDESIGTYGRLYCYIRTGSHSGSLVDTLQLDLHGKEDFQYIYAGQSVTSGSNPNAWVSGYCENLDLQEAYVTFYFTTGGEIAVYNWNMIDFIQPTNGSEHEFGNNMVIKLMAVPQNESYIFTSFNWTGGSSTTNPHNYTVTANMTIWCYFGTVEAPTPYIVARFTFNVSNPEPNDSILFNGSYSESSASITDYNWTFGDDNSDYGETVTHSYMSEGTYQITLNATSSVGTDSFSLNLTVATSGGVIFVMARFTWNITNPDANQTILFNGTWSNSSSAISSYCWDWGDGSEAGSGETPTHSFSSNGTYPVNLTVTSGVGTDSFVEEVTIGGGGDGAGANYPSAGYLLVALTVLCAAPVVGFVLVLVLVKRRR